MTTESIFPCKSSNLMEINGLRGRLTEPDMNIGEFCWKVVAGA